MAETRKMTRTPKTSKAKPVDEYGHLQPQAPELEEAVLGALMIEKDAYSLVSEILRPESFYERRHQLIYSAITSLALRQQPVDILSVAEQLRSTGELDVAGKGNQFACKKLLRDDTCVIFYVCGRGYLAA